MKNLFKMNIFSTSEFTELRCAIAIKSDKIEQIYTSLDLISASSSRPPHFDSISTNQKHTI